MQRPITRTLSMALCLGLTVAAAALNSETRHCSTAGTAGKWAYTYTGTISTPRGPLQAAVVGHFRSDAAGNLTGHQTRSVGGRSAVEDISGTNSVNANCTSKMTIKVFVDGQLHRTAVGAVVFDRNMNHARAIFQSLVLPDGTNVPVVLTANNSRLFPRDHRRQ